MVGITEGGDILRILVATEDGTVRVPSGEVLVITL